MPFDKEAILGSVANFRGRFNMFTLVLAFVLSIMVIHNTRQCEKNKGYPSSAPMVTMDYTIAIIILIVVILLFVFDLYNKFKPS